MPPTATLEDIKAHQQRVEKNKITPDNLPPCPRCNVESAFFKIHAYRERRFLIIIEMFINAVYCSLVRFGCPGCGKTFTHYPDFAIPHKRFTRQTITAFSANYIESKNMTYQQAVMVDNDVPGYPQTDSADAPTLAPSSIHRWITSLSRFTQTCRTSLILLLQENPVSSICRDLARLIIPQRKYKTHQRKKQLIGCRQLMIVEAFFQATFKTSIFTKLAIRHSFN
jgi:transposase-like protein